MKENPQEKTQYAQGLLHPVVGPGDRIDVGCELKSGEVWWGNIQTVKKVTTDGEPIYRPKWAKVDKIAALWRWPNDPDHWWRTELRRRAGMHETIKRQVQSVIS